MIWGLAARAAYAEWNYKSLNERREAISAIELDIFVQFSNIPAYLPLGGHKNAS